MKAKLIQKILRSLSQQKTVFLTSLLCFVFLCLSSAFNAEFRGEKNRILLQLTLGFFLACVFSVPGTFISLKFSTLKKYLIQLFTAFAGFSAGFFLSPPYIDADNWALYYSGLFFSVIAFSLFLFSHKANPKTYFALVLKHFFSCLLMSLVFLAGFLIISFLLRNFGSLDYACERVDGHASFFFIEVFAVNSFTYFIFHHRGEESSGRVFKVIVLYILFPAFALLTLILYACLIKSLAGLLLSPPDADLNSNLFISIATASYIFFYFILREFEDLPPVRFFYRFGSLFMLPLILIQIPAFAIRVTAYGFTPARVASLLYILFSVIMISLTFVKKGTFCKYSILLLTLLFLFGSVSPLNIYKLAGKSQIARMISVLEKYEIFDKEKGSLADYDHEDFSGRISDSDRKKLFDSYEYLDESGFLPKWADFSLNFALKYEEKRYKRGCFFLNPGNMRNSEGELNFKMKTYRSHSSKPDSEIIAEMEAQGFSETDVFTSEGQYYYEIPAAVIFTACGRIDIREFLLSLPENGTGSQPIYFDAGEKVRLCFTEIDYSYNKDLGFFKNYEVSGYVFCK